MPRISRTVFADIPHHITQRGNRRENVFFTDDDRNVYLGWLKEYCSKHDVDVLAYCLMTNHRHLVAVPNSEEGLQRGWLKAMTRRNLRCYDEMLKKVCLVEQRNLFADWKSLQAGLYITVR